MAIRVEAKFVPVSGESFDNRQSIIRKLSDGDPLILVREADNKYDENAVRVDTIEGKTIGYIAKTHNGKFARALDQEQRLDCIINSIHGGHGKKKSLGVVISIAPEGKLSALNPGMKWKWFLIIPAIILILMLLN